jgi:hypothetical protein
MRTSRHVRLLSGRKLLLVAIVGNAKITEVLTNCQPEALSQIGILGLAIIIIIIIIIIKTSSMLEGQPQGHVITH